MNIPLVTPLIHYFKVFFNYAGNKIFFLCFVILLGGVSESVGISILLPILDFDAEKSAQSSYTQMIHRIIEGVGFEVSLLSLLVLLFILFSLKGAFYFVQEVISSHIMAGLTKSIMVDLYKRYAAMKYTYFTGVNIGYLNNVITTEAKSATGGFSKYILVMVNIIFIFIYVSSAFMINWHITVLVILLSFCLFAMLRKLSKISRKLSLLVSETNGRIQSLLIQMLYNFKYLKATNSFSHIFKHLYKRIDENRHYQYKNMVISAIPASIVEPITIFFLSGLILYYVGFKGNTMGEIMILLIFFYRAFYRIFNLQINWQKFNANIGGIETLERMTKELEANKEYSGLQCIEEFKDKIVLEDVNFSYGAKQILFDINITIPKNKSIGIVGESGAGKTTLFDIITALLTPQSGTVKIDGVYYKEINRLLLRKLFGYVTQDPVIFNDTIANNISLWKDDCQDKENRKLVEKAAISSNSLDFIEKTENDFETLIGDKGIKLSGGQRQRIAIAREIFKDPDILIFDEATSSLDTESEMYIQRSINAMKGKRTLIIIAHRLSTIRNCDYIYILSNGRIVEEGEFEILYKQKDTIFHKMCQMQNV